jgi:hypothetical protein
MTTCRVYTTLVTKLITLLHYYYLYGTGLLLMADHTQALNSLGVSTRLC